jgi:hypothetical protein
MPADFDPQGQNCRWFPRVGKKVLPFQVIARETGFPIQVPFSLHPIMGHLCSPSQAVASFATAATAKKYSFDSIECISIPLRVNALRSMSRPALQLLLQPGSAARDYGPPYAKTSLMQDV